MPSAGAVREGGAAVVNRGTAVVADRKESIALVASTRRFGRVL